MAVICEGEKTSLIMTEGVEIVNGVCSLLVMERWTFEGRCPVVFAMIGCGMTA